MDYLMRELAHLKQEIKKDEEGLQEFDARLGLMKKERQAVQDRFDENKRWAAGFDTQIGPFERMYHNLTNEISGLYDNAKKEHQDGIQVLMDEFEYHPIFKRWSDNFTAVPFRPK